MKITIELGTFMLYIGFLFIWTKWYLPIRITYTRYPSTGYVTISILWFLHINFRFPMPFKPDRLLRG